MDSTLPGAILPEVLQDAIVCNVKAALEEDVGSGDLTARLLPTDQKAIATILCREPAVICGIPWAERCFWQLDPTLQIQWKIVEGDLAQAGQTICEIAGNARAMLTAERCALNFLQALSATATATKRYVEMIKDTKARIYDTRKTLPGLRLAQKYAVLVGGGENQRMSLQDGILIKENHIVAAGGIAQVLQAARELVKESDHDIPVQIEVENLAQLRVALDAGAMLILLDNFSLQALHEAVELNKGCATLEASGGINLGNVREIALTGVDRISIGDITKNLKAVDLSMRFKTIH